MNPFSIERASFSDTDNILCLYRSLVGTLFCTWDDEYPSREIIENDIASYKVFIVRNEGGRIIAAAVSARDDSLNSLAPWYADVEQWALLTRLGVAQEHQNRGIARRLVSFIMEEARQNGAQGIRFFVSPENIPAQRMYQSIGFDVCGKAEHYGLNWLCYQRRLTASK